LKQKTKGQERIPSFFPKTCRIKKAALDGKFAKAAPPEAKTGKNKYESVVVVFGCFPRATVG
jgi:hypothetical protein